jgi:hypothetical protein
VWTSQLRSGNFVRRHVLHMSPSTGCRLAFAQVVAAGPKRNFAPLWVCLARTDSPGPLGGSRGELGTSYFASVLRTDALGEIKSSAEPPLRQKRTLRSTRSGCPQWEVPRVGTPAPTRRRCRQLGYTGEAEWCPDASSWTSSQTRRCQATEEMRGPPSGRAQEGRRQPRRDQRISERNRMPYGRL